MKLINNTMEEYQALVYTIQVNSRAYVARWLAIARTWLAKYYYSLPSSQRKTKWLLVSNRVTIKQVKLLFGPLVIQLVWYILKQLFTSVWYLPEENNVNQNTGFIYSILVHVRSKVTDFAALSYTSACEILPFHISEAWKKCSLRPEPVIGSNPRRGFKLITRPLASRNVSSFSFRKDEERKAMRRLRKIAVITR